MLNKTLYISSAEVGAGSLIVAMGVMRALKARYAKVAFYRPVIASSDIQDNDIKFMLDYFGLKLDYADTHSFTLDELATQIVKNGKDGVLAEVIKKFKALEADYDFVLIQGLSRTSLASIVDFDLNLEIAKTLNAPTLAVINAKDKTFSVLQNEIEAQKLTLSHNDCLEFGIFVNRVSPQIKDQLAESAKHFKDIFMIKESKELESQTLIDIKNSLGCELILGDESKLDKSFSDISIAAMEIENYLKNVKNEDLVVVPGDRVDILLASLVSYYAKTTPHIAGIVLSGGIRPSTKILNMISEVHEIKLPILLANSDTYHTVRAIENMPSKITSKNDRKISLALGLFGAAIEGVNFEDKFNVDYNSYVMTPQMFEYGLFEGHGQNKKTIILDEVDDERILRATEVLLRQNVVNIILLGDESDITYRAGLLGLDISKARVINPSTSIYKEQFIQELYEMRKAKGMTLDLAKDTMEKSSYFGTMMVQLGYADGMVSGATHTTAETVRPALQIIKTKPGISIVSSVFFMCLDTKVLVYGDCAIIPDPTEQELAEIAISAATTAAAFGIVPKVAMLSYSTGSSGTGADVDKVRNATAIAQKLRPDLLIDGPMQYDAATDPSVGKSKAPNSKVAGEANVLIFPDLNAGNNAYKAVQRSSGAIAIGPVLQGLNKPVNDLSRGCTVRDIVTTVAVTAIQSEDGK